MGGENLPGAEQDSWWSLQIRNGTRLGKLMIGAVTTADEAIEWLGTGLGVEWTPQAISVKLGVKDDIAFVKERSL